LKNIDTPLEALRAKKKKTKKKKKSDSRVAVD
jgi:hypothetical protein